MLKVGITGSIACGKSFIGHIFERFGVRIIDSDLIAREVVLPGSPVLKKIAACFGREILTPELGLNRPVLRQIVFADRDKLNALNSIIHPAIHELLFQYCQYCAQGLPFPETYRQIYAQCHHKPDNVPAFLGPAADGSEDELILNPKQPSPYVLLDIPLLFENHLESFVDRILVVDCSEHTQIERLMARDNCDKEQALQIVGKQLPRQHKLNGADDIINTDSSNMDEKRQAVLNLHRKYLRIARDCL